jgi:hypothetical protein
MAQRVIETDHIAEAREDDEDSQYFDEVDSSDHC